MFWPEPRGSRHFASPQSELRWQIAAPCLSCNAPLPLRQAFPEGSRQARAKRTFVGTRTETRIPFMKLKTFATQLFAVSLVLAAAAAQAGNATADEATAM